MLVVSGRQRLLERAWSNHQVLETGAQWKRSSIALNTTQVLETEAECEAKLEVLAPSVLLVILTTATASIDDSLSGNNAAVHHQGTRVRLSVANVHCNNKL